LADFSDANLINADFTNAHLICVNFAGARTTGTIFTGATMDEVTSTSFQPPVGGSLGDRFFSKKALCRPPKQATQQPSSLAENSPGITR
jgi:hypothetical protein